MGLSNSIYELDLNIMRKYYATNMRNLRKDKFLTMKDISRGTNITEDTLYRIQRGEETRPETIKIIAKFLDMNYDRDEKGIYFYEVESTDEYYKEERRSDYTVPGMVDIINIIRNLSDKKRIKLVDFLKQD